jgi:nucleotide-binding universal stress UspA family protein
MSLTVLLATDGSSVALAALRRGLLVLGASDRIVVATVIELTHASDVAGTGMAGGLLSPEAAARHDAEARREGEEVLRATCSSLGLDGAELVVLDGSAGPVLCDLAAALPADVIALGTRGHGGLRRAVLGSVSDHVVRNAPCPVVISSPE